MADNKKTEVTQPAEEKKTNKQRLKDITDSIENGIKELFESDKYQQYLHNILPNPYELLSILTFLKCYRDAIA